MGRFLYIFLDESGNFDFSKNGTKYCVLTSVTKERPFNAYRELCDLKYDLIESGDDREYFHATEDPQNVRNKVFDIISKHLAGVRVDSIIVEKRKTHPALHPLEKFYPKILAYLLRYIVNGHDISAFQELIVITDQIPNRSKREAIKKAIKTNLAEMLPNTKYRILHHDSKSCFDLQIADYCSWAIYKKWDQNELRPYKVIKQCVVSEFDIFLSGTKVFY